MKTQRTKLRGLYGENKIYKLSMSILAAAYYGRKAVWAITLALSSYWTDSNTQAGLESEKKKKNHRKVAETLSLVQY